MLQVTAARADLRDMGTAAAATPSPGPRTGQPRATGRRELKRPGEIPAIGAAPAQQGLGPACPRLRGLGARQGPGTSASPCTRPWCRGGWGSASAGRAGDRRQLSKFEGEDRAKGTGRTLRPLRRSRSKSPRD